MSVKGWVRPTVKGAPEGGWGGTWVGATRRHGVRSALAWMKDERQW
jgi:hypothetical protein